MIDQSTVHMPILRCGEPYESLDKHAVRDPATGDLRANVSVANAGMIRHDAKRWSDAFHILQKRTTAEMIAICQRAGDLFLTGTLPVTGTADQYVHNLSSTSGLPHVMCRNNMGKVAYVLTHMDEILHGLSRGLPIDIIDCGFGEQNGAAVSLLPAANHMGVVLPSNSPGVNSIWIPAVALRIPVVLKPGSDEPWTPYRIIESLLEAGCPREAVSFYPTSHDGANEIMQLCERAIIFGDEKTVSRYADDPAIQVHGPGWSKVILGDDVVDGWPAYIDIIAESIIANGGRSCINASAVFAPRHGDAIAEALAAKLGPIQPTTPDDPAAKLSAFANPQFAAYIDQSIEAGLKEAGAVDVCTPFRHGPRLAILEGRTYLRPTIVRCNDITHPLANTEYMCPFASVVEVPQVDVLDVIGPTLAASVITRDAGFIAELMACRHIDRLNIGPAPTSAVKWDQPHEGNLFEFLYRRRAVSQAPDWVSA